MNQIYSFGLGASGQLGTGHEENQFQPKLIELPASGISGKVVSKIAASTHHSRKYRI
jgi:hypothetical protein